MVQDVVRQGISPATGSEVGSQSVTDFNLRVDGVLYVPVSDENTLNGGKDRDGAIKLSLNAEGDLILNSYADGKWTEYLAVLDGLKSVGGINLAGNEVTVVAPVKWRINSVNYEKLTDTVFNIPNATDGYNRIDLLYATTSNTVLKIQGTETTGVAVEPNLPTDSVRIAPIFISGDVIQQPIPDLDLYLTKTQADELYIQASPMNAQQDDIFLRESIGGTSTVRYTGGGFKFYSSDIEQASFQFGNNTFILNSVSPVRLAGMEIIQRQSDGAKVLFEGDAIPKVGGEVDGKITGSDLFPITDPNDYVQAGYVGGINDYGQYALRDEDKLYILAHYYEGQRLKIIFEKCMLNELMTFSKVEIINSVGTVTKEEFLKTGSVIIDAFTDYIGPYRVDQAFVGGNHLIDGFKTASTSYYDFLIDGESIISDSIVKSDNIDVRVTNLIFDPHFVSDPNPATDIIEQVLYSIVSGKIEITLNASIQRDGLTMQSYYGAQSVSINLPKLYVAHSSFPNGVLSNFTNNTSYGSIASFPNIEKMIWTANDNSDCMAVWIDRDFGLGKTVAAYNDTDNSFVQTSNNKAYFYLIGQEQVFNSDDVLSWHGGYNCFKNQSFSNNATITYTQPQGKDNLAIVDFITNTTITEFLSTIGQENDIVSVKKKDSNIVVDNNIISAKGASIRSSGVGNIYLSTKDAPTPSLQDVTSVGNITQDRLFTIGTNVPNGFPTTKSTWVGQSASGAGIIESFDYANLVPNMLEINPGGGAVNIANLAGTGTRPVAALANGTLGIDTGGARLAGGNVFTGGHQDVRSDGDVRVYNTASGASNYNSTLNSGGVVLTSTDQGTVTTYGQNFLNRLHSSGFYSRLIFATPSTANRLQTFADASGDVPVVLASDAFSNASPPTSTSAGARGSVWYNPVTKDRYDWIADNVVARYFADPSF